jgi:hypothetical protein
MIDIFLVFSTHLIWTEKQKQIFIEYEYKKEIFLSSNNEKLNNEICVRRERAKERKSFSREHHL